MNKNNKMLLIILGLSIILAILLVTIFKKDNLNSKSGPIGKSNGNSDTTSEITITTESTDLDIKILEDDKKEEYDSYSASIDLNNLYISGFGVSISNKTITITEDGVYYFTGSSDDANIVVNTPDNALVVIVLDNVNLTSTTTSAIVGIGANKIIINLKEGSENYIEDASEYTAFIDEEEPDATIFSKTDLTINGKGTLIATSNYKDGIASKDDLIILNSLIILDATDDGIRGKNSVVIQNAEIKIDAEGDGIKATKTDLGYIYIDGGRYSIDVKGDGFDAKNIIEITGESAINITTRGDVEDKTTSSSERFQFTGARNFTDDIKTSDDSENSVSSKGIKADQGIIIDNGQITIISTDDAIHSNGYIIIDNINVSISTGNGGIHAEQSIIINNGDINITKSYEGIEAQYIEINDGNISLITRDDGININGGSEEMFRTHFGQNNSDDSKRLLVINGGTIYVNANGDGLDSNGAIKITGGNIKVAGSTNSGNGALDYNYTCVVTGGNLIYYGASGMWQDPTSDSTINTVAFAYSGKSGDIIVLKDSSGNTIEELTAEKTYQKIGFTNSKLKTGETYILYINEEEIDSIEVTSYVSSNSLSNSENMLKRNDDHF